MPLIIPLHNHTHNQYNGGTHFRSYLRMIYRKRGTFMEYDYKTNGVCSNWIHFNVEDEVIQSVAFEGGCEGNLSGLSRLVEGMPPKEAAQRLAGITCGRRGTSCPDQLSKALSAWIKEHA